MYSWYVTQLAKDLFQLELSCRDEPHRGVRLLSVCSKTLINFLMQEYGVPSGKKEHLRIPSSIIKDKHCFLTFVRGLFDTDGCVFYRNTHGYVYPVIKICSNDHLFLEQISIHLNYYGFRSYVNRRSGSGWGNANDLVINGYEQLIQGIYLIGTSNPRNLLAMNGDRGI